MKLSEIPHKLAHHKTRFETLPAYAQLIILALAHIVFLAAIILTVVFPEAGLPLLVASLVVLSFRFEWARRFLFWLIDQATKLAQWWCGLPSLARTILTVGILVLVSYLLILGYNHFIMKQ